MPFFDDIPEDLAAFEAQFPDNAACVAHVYRIRFPDGWRCPKCNHPEKTDLKTGRWQCKRCRAQSSITSDTIFHGTRHPLLSWFKTAYWMAYDACSANEVARRLGIWHETAWSWMIKLRTAVHEADQARREKKIVWHRYLALPKCPYEGKLQSQDWFTPVAEPIAKVREEIRYATSWMVSEKHIDKYIATRSLAQVCPRLSFTFALLAIGSRSRRIPLVEITGPHVERPPMRWFMSDQTP